MIENMKEQLLFMWATMPEITITFFILISILIFYSPIVNQYRKYKKNKNKEIISIVDIDIPEESYLKCPNCNNDKWHEGPGGGSFGNIKCGGCGKWYNNLGPFGLREIH